MVYGTEAAIQATITINRYQRMILALLKEIADRINIA